jgi:hypothetical protein
MLFVRAHNWSTNHPCRMIAVFGDVWAMTNRRQVLRLFARRLEQVPDVKISPLAAAILEKACRPTRRERLAVRYREWKEQRDAPGA